MIIATFKIIAQLAVVVQYADCFIKEGQDPSNECSAYEIKQSDGEVPVILDLGKCGVPLHCHRSQVPSSPEW